MEIVSESETQKKVTETVTLVAPNGARTELKFKSHEKVEHLLKEAVKEFAKEGQLDSNVDYILVLSEQRLDGHLTLEQAGVTPGATLKVRSRKTPGDGSASGVR